MRGAARGAALLLAAVLAGCGDDKPVLLGFIGGVSGRVADLGVGGRNGVILAIEEQNRQGGIHGRPLALQVEDDHQDGDAARAAVDHLIDGGASAVLGPMTSAMAMAIVPRANQARLLVMGITVTTNDLSGLDDYFFRTLPPTRVHAGVNAEYNFNHFGIRRVAIALDRRNLAFAESWRRDFTERFEQLGGTVTTSVGFESSGAMDFQPLATQLLSGAPQAVVSICNSLDAALLAKAVRSQQPGIHLITSEWGATERLLAMGGRHVEGLVAAQFFDRDNTQPAFRAFVDTYRQRFGLAPGYPATTGYNAARVVIEGLLAQRPGQSLKASLLARGTFDGLQAPIPFDAYGDTTGRTYLTQVQDGHFHILDVP